MGHTSFIQNTKVNKSGPDSETRAYSEGSYLYTNAKILLSSAVPPIAACSSTSAEPAAHLSAKEILTATSKFPKGCAGQVGSRKASRSFITWPAISFQTKVWEHLIRKLQPYLKGRYGKPQKSISLKQNPRLLWQQMVSPPGGEDGQGPLTHKILFIPLLANIS